MSSKGQVTLPVEVRRFFNLQEGDQVDFFLDPVTRMVSVVARNGKLSDLRDIAERQSEVGQSPKEIDDAIGKYLAEDDERIRTAWNELREFQEWRKAKSLRAAE